MSTSISALHAKSKFATFWSSSKNRWISLIVGSFILISLLVLLICSAFQPSYAVERNKAVVTDWWRVQGEELYSYFAIEFGEIDGFEGYDFNSPQRVNFDDYGPNNVDYHCMDNWADPPHPHLPECAKGTTCDVVIEWYYSDAEYDYYHIRINPPGADVSVQSVGAQDIKIPRPKGAIEIHKSSTLEWAYELSSYCLYNDLAYDVYDDYGNVQTIWLTNAGDNTGVVRLENLPVGHYKVHENPEHHGIGYKHNDTWIDVQVTANNTSYVGANEGAIDTPLNDPEPVKIEKADLQTTEEGLPEGAVPSFEHAYYDYQYYSDYFKLKSEIASHSASYHRHWVMETDKKGITNVSNDYKDKKIAGDDFYYSKSGTVICPLGTYVIHETKAPEGYLLSDKYYIVQVVVDSTKPAGAGTKVYDADTGQELQQIIDPQTGTPFTKALEQVKKGDYKFTKVDEDMREMSGIPFKITSVTTGEWHIVVTDLNGMVDTSSANIPHTQKTNANDALYNPATGKITDETQLVMDAGCWFALDTKTGVVAPAVDDVGALPYDSYTIEELEISKNKIYYPFGTKSFVVTKDEYEVDGGTWVNSKKVCVTEARGITGTQELYATEREQAFDRINYSGLLQEHQYEIKAWLVERSTGDIVPLLDGYDGEDYIRHVFIANSSVGYTDVSTYIDTRAYSGKSIVWYVELYDVGLTRLIVDHKDIIDKSETLSVIQPLFDTDLTDKFNTGKSVSKRADEVLQDKISYQKVKVGAIYNLYGVLYDKATGKPYINEITKEQVVATAQFIPTAENGTTYIYYEFDSTLCKEELVLVSFVELRVGDVAVSNHKSLDDERQQVKIPKTELSTIATYEDGNKYFIADDGSIAIDCLNYKGLPQGKEIQAYSWFSYNDSGLPVTDGDLDNVEALDKISVLVNALGGRVTMENTEINGEEEEEPSWIEQWLVAFFKVPKKIDEEKLKDVDWQALKHVMFTNQTIVPATEDGSININFEFNASKTPAGKIVAYTILVVDDCVIGALTDINNEDETLEILRSHVQTNLSDAKGNKEFNPDEKTILVDRVMYDTVLVGREYKLKGQIIDKLTEQVLSENEIAFKPEKIEGEIDLAFELDTSSLAGHDLVCYETLILDETEAVIHHDINDADQTVHVIGIIPGILPQTSDIARFTVFLAILAVLGYLGIRLYRKRARNANKDIIFRTDGLVY